MCVGYSISCKFYVISCKLLQHMLQVLGSSRTKAQGDWAFEDG